MDGRNPASPKGWLKPYKSWDVYHRFNWCRISQPSTVWTFRIFMGFSLFRCQFLKDTQVYEELDCGWQALGPKAWTFQTRAITGVRCSSTKRAKSTGHSWLVGGIPTPSEKWWSSSVGMIIPNIWKNKTCSKPPTSWSFMKCPMIFQPLQLRSHTKTHRTWIPPGIPTSPSLNSKGSWPDLHHTQFGSSQNNERFTNKNGKIAKTEGSSSHAGE